MSPPIRPMTMIPNIDTRVPVDGCVKSLASPVAHKAENLGVPFQLSCRLIFLRWYSIESKINRPVALPYGASSGIEALSG